MSVYKPFKPQDYAVVPFNAHKQYDFTSASAATNKVTYFATNWDYDSPVDEYTNDVIKYNQIEHLFYRNYLTDISNKFGDINYLKHKRSLYEKANILSIPTGLYGHKIKPGSFLLSSFGKSIVDDTYGNLIIEGTNVDDYITDPRSTLLNIGSVNGFKKYDLNIHDTFIEGIYYKKGQKRVNTLNLYNTPSDKYEYDDSYFLNKIYYKDIEFKPFYFNSTDTTKTLTNIDFNGLTSEVKIYHDDKFNFNSGDDFSIEFWIEPFLLLEPTTRHIIGKSTSKTSILNPTTEPTTSYPLKDITAESQFPFEVFLQYDGTAATPHLNFNRSNGNTTTSLSSDIPTGIPSHVVCRYSSSKMDIFINGASTVEGVEDSEGIYQNNANIYIGNKGNNSNYFTGSLSQVKIYNKAITQTQITNHYNSINGSPYIGNIFYSNGLITITHPKYNEVLNSRAEGIGGMIIDDEDIETNTFTVGSDRSFGIDKLSFQGSHLIYENEYKCTIDEHEFNHTLNPSARKRKTIKNDELANFTTGSLFKPYITTIGLYNENNELLVVGKLGQPIRTSNETDTTFIVRWDT